jgi:hypothetical protein
MSLAERRLSGPRDGGGTAGECSPPGDHAVDLYLEREAEECPDQHDQAEDQDVAGGRCDSNGPEQVRGHEDF